MPDCVISLYVTSIDKTTSGYNTPTVKGVLVLKTSRPKMAIAHFSDFFYRTQKQLVGIYDKSLLGKAYKAYNWTKDAEYNKQRKTEIIQKYTDKISKSIYFEKRADDKISIYIAVSPKTARRLLMMMRTALPKPLCFRLYRARSKIIDKPLPVYKIASYEKWFLKNEEIQ